MSVAATDSQEHAVQMKNKWKINGKTINDVLVLEMAENVRKTTQTWSGRAVASIKGYFKMHLYVIESHIPFYIHAGGMDVKFQAIPERIEFGGVSL